MRTRAEVRAFLDRQVGTVVPHPGNYDLRGQCVTLTKALMDFLGVPNPYAARGDAKDAGDTYLRQGLGKSGRGWLTIVVNRDMGYIGGVHYGHIWIDLLNESNYESNGARALVTTKNTRPVSQGQQFINFDQWIESDKPKPPKEVIEMIPDQDNYYWRWGQKAAMQLQNRELSRDEFRKWIAGQNGTRALEVLSDDPAADRAQGWQVLGKRAAEGNWETKLNQLQAALNGSVSKADLDAAKKIADTLKTQLDAANKENQTRIEEKLALDKKIAEYEAREASDKEAGDSFLRRVGQLISKYLGGK